MKCYNCGCDLSRKNFCTSCGADVTVYKKIMYISNRYYNDGLDKANVRDLSGAVISLRQSLKFNKHNIDARNLLGLVYFEMGEVVAALSEWVISKNLRSKKNLADDYIEAIQSNPARLETINQTVKKFNLALHYCYQDSKDLAIIQLKKVLSMNPRLVQGHQLLALLYIDAEDWGKAKRELIRCCKIDANNTTTLGYLKLVNEMLRSAEEANGKQKQQSSQPKVEVSQDAFTYQSGNETIIQPLNVNEPKGTSSILNIIIGILIGLAVSYFLILPARIQFAQKEMKEEIKVVSENLDTKTARITELETENATLTQTNKDLQLTIDSYTGGGAEGEKTDSLMQAAINYLSSPDDYKNIADALYSVDQSYLNEEATDAYKQLYNKLVFAVGPNVAERLYQDGAALVNQSDYSAAIETLEKAWFFSKNMENPEPEILYQLAQAYSLSGEKNKAEETYAKILGEFPDSQAATKTKDRLQDEGIELPATTSSDTGSSSNSSTSSTSAGAGDSSSSDSNSNTNNTENGNTNNGDTENSTAGDENIPATAGDDVETVVHM